MANVEEEYLRLIIEFEGEPALQRAHILLDSIHSDAKLVTDEFKKGAISLSQYNDEMKLLAQEGAKARAVIDGFGKAASAADGQINAASRSVNSFDNMLRRLESGGIAGAMRALPSLFGNIAQAAGLTGPALGMAVAGMNTLATAAYLVYENFDTLTGHDPVIKAFFQSLGQSLNPFHVERYATQLEKLTDRIKELKDMGPTRLAVETHELDEAQKKVKELEEAKRSLDELMGKQNETEKASGQAFEKAIVETPGGQEGINRLKTQRAAEMQRQLENSPAFQKAQGLRDQLAMREKMPASRENFDVIQELKAQLKEAQEDQRRAQTDVAKQAGPDLGELTKRAIHGKGKEQSDAQARLVRELEAQGPQNKNLGRDLRQAHPDVVVTPAGEKEMGERLGEAKDEERRRDKVAKERAAADKKLNDDVAKNVKDRQDKAKQAHKQRVTKAAGDYSGPLDKSVEDAMSFRERHGEKVADIDKALADEVAKRLQRVPDDIRADVSKEIVAKAREKFEADQTKFEVEKEQGIDKKGGKGRVVKAGGKGGGGGAGAGGDSGPRIYSDIQEYFRNTQLAALGTGKDDLQREQLALQRQQKQAADDGNQKLDAIKQFAAQMVGGGIVGGGVQGPA